MIKTENKQELLKLEGIIKEVKHNLLKENRKTDWLRFEIQDTWQNIKYVIAWGDFAKNGEQWFHGGDYIRVSGTVDKDNLLDQEVLTLRTESYVKVNNKTLYEYLGEPTGEHPESELKTTYDELNYEEKQILEAKSVVKELPVKLKNEFNCSECNKVYKTEKGLANHIQVHTNNKSEKKDVDTELISVHKPSTEHHTNITAEMVRKEINPLANDLEIALFMELCKTYNLNPKLDVYLIKYSKDSKAQMVVAKDYFIKNAHKQPDFHYYIAGISVLKDNNEIEDRKGSLLLENEKLVGGWCEVYFKDEKPTFQHSVTFSEYNTKKSQWNLKPATMIRKVALVQALRECFPETFSRLYDSSEMGVELPND